MERYGYITALDGIRLLQAGIPIFVVSAPLDTRALPLEGGWKDEEGRIHYDCSCICLNIEKAYEIGRLYEQECILALYPSYASEGEVYLLKDTPFARQIALEYAGGYTADGEWLFTAFKGDASPFSEAYEEFLPVEIEFLPVK
jgi:hypothetical protein